MKQAKTDYTAEADINNDNAISNLTNAITGNANYKVEAAIDLEFVNLRTNEAFIKLTK